MRLILGLVLAVACASPAWADDWWFFSVTGTAKAYIDMSSVSEQPNGYRAAWLRRFDPGASRTLRDAQIYEFAERWETDCNQGRARIIELVLFDRRGVEVERSTGASEWAEGSPGTNVELMVHVLCENDRLELHDVGAANPTELRGVALRDGAI